MPSNYQSTHSGPARVTWLFWPQADDPTRWGWAIRRSRWSGHAHSLASAPAHEGLTVDPGLPDRRLRVALVTGLRAVSRIARGHPTDAVLIVDAVRPSNPPRVLAAPQRKPTPLAQEVAGA